MSDSSIRDFDYIVSYYSLYKDYSYVVYFAKRNIKDIYNLSLLNGKTLLDVFQYFLFGTISTPIFFRMV